MGGTRPADRVEDAEAFALMVLSWTLADPGRAVAFLDACGLAPKDLKARVSDPVFLGGVLDHLMSDDALLLAFCADAAQQPTRPAHLRRYLPGAPPD